MKKGMGTHSVVPRKMDVPIGKVLGGAEFF